MAVKFANQRNLNVKKTFAHEVIFKHKISALPGQHKCYKNDTLLALEE